MKMLQQLALEYHVAEQFSYDEMLAQMEAENQSRAGRVQSGEAVYGSVEYTPLQYYHILMGENERAIKDQWISGSSREGLLAYYEAHLEDYRQTGEITADVQISLGGRERSAAGRMSRGWSGRSPVRGAHPIPMRNSTR